MERPLHLCHGGCNRQIPDNFNYCMFCKIKLREQNLCCWCGEKPRAPWDRKKKQKLKLSDYCVECKEERRKESFNNPVERLPEPYHPKYRDGGARENTSQTKFGE